HVVALQFMVGLVRSRNSFRNELAGNQSVHVGARFDPYPRSVVEVRLIRVVRPAPQLDVLHGGRATHRMRPHVMEFQETSLRTAPPAPGHEPAPSTFTGPDSPLDPRRYMPRAVASGQVAGRPRIR